MRRSWSFLLSTSFSQGSILDAFVDPTQHTATRTNATFQDPAAGSAQVAATATALGGGRFRYVYVLMNHDFDPKLSSFSIPIITLIAFILMMIIAVLLNIIFWWLPLLKICLPLNLKARA